MIPERFVDFTIALYICIKWYRCNVDPAEQHHAHEADGVGSSAEEPPLLESVGLSGVA